MRQNNQPTGVRLPPQVESVSKAGASSFSRRGNPMIRPPIAAICWVVLAQAAPDLVVTCYAGQSWQETFQREAPKTWQKYAERARRLQGKWTSTTRSITQKEVISHEWGEFKQRDGCYLFVGQSQGEGQKRDVRGELSAVNPYYAFQFRRSARNDPWLITGFGANLWERGSYSDPQFQVESLLHRPYKFGGALPEGSMTLLDQGFVIKKVVPLQRDGEQLVQVDFRCSFADRASSRGLHSGSVVLDPQRNWVMRSFTAKAKWGDVEINYVVALAYAETRDRFPLLKKITADRRVTGTNRHFLQTSEYDLEEKDVPESEFRVSAFGFREPLGVPPPGLTRWYLWFLGIGAVALGAGWYWRRRVLQRRALTSAKPDPSTVEERRSPTAQSG
ncbi:MAG: hypothetical protein HYX68_06345 [Planctomycetes bacterium]|nr:hypothetical protein [Planctomycetota bacterium]